VNRTVAERLYYQPWARDAAGTPATELEFRAVVTDIRLVSRGHARNAAPGAGQAGAAEAQLWQVSLDRTAFYPEAGGQPWDTGVLIATARSGAVLEIAVERVEEDEAGEVWHYVAKPLVEGTAVVGKVDAERRLDHTQQHSGQHLLSAVFLRELGARTVSFHLSAYAGADGADQPATIDLAGVASLGRDDLSLVAAAANRLIYQDREMRSRWVSRAEAESMLERGDLRKLPEFSDYRAGGPVRIVEIEGVEFNACGGTHVTSTGAIGSVLVRRVERVKQGWRVEFCCGLRAVRLAGSDFARLTEAAALLSTGIADVPGRVASLLEEGRAAAKQRKALLEALTRSEAAAAVAGAEPEAVVHATFGDKDLEFIQRVAVRITELGRAAVIGTTGIEQAGQPAGGGIAAARRPGSPVHCGNVVREALSEVGGRGGGPAEMAQGICRADQVASVMARLSQALRQ
jgi:alanyl-tRNA synthetase